MAEVGPGPVQMALHGTGADSEDLSDLLDGQLVDVVEDRGLCLSTGQAPYLSVRGERTRRDGRFRGGEATPHPLGSGVAAKVKGLLTGDKQRAA